jgi:ubiquinone/menaquinone biosynthesis C-methylase UbiE
MIETAHGLDTDHALKAKHRAMWALGDYHAVVTNVVAELGSILVQECGLQPGERVLDLAAGSGNVAIPAALAGARVTAADLTPELLAVGRGTAAQQHVELDWIEADAEELPFPEGEFDVVMSCLGIMFAPHHQTAADEALRVCRSGGRIGLLSWTPEGFVGELFRAVKAYAPPPPSGVQPAPLWGDESHVRALLGDRVTDVVAQRRTLTVDRFADPEDWREFFKDVYGPIIAVYRSLGTDAERIQALNHNLAELAHRYDRGTGHLIMDWEYLVLTARRSQKR